ncbi:Hypothetical protein CINCED_3A004330, partial [Cinara cedri]
MLENDYNVGVLITKDMAIIIGMMKDLSLTRRCHSIKRHLSDLSGKINDFKSAAKRSRIEGAVIETPSQIGRNRSRIRSTISYAPKHGFFVVKSGSANSCKRKVREFSGRVKTQLLCDDNRVYNQWRVREFPTGGRVPCSSFFGPVIRTQDADPGLIIRSARLQAMNLPEPSKQSASLYLETPHLRHAFWRLTKISELLAMTTGS